LYVPVVALDHHRHFHATESRLHTYFRVFGRGGRGAGGEKGTERRRRRRRRRNGRGGRGKKKKNSCGLQFPTKVAVKTIFLNNKQNKTKQNKMIVLPKVLWKLLRFCFSSSSEDGENFVLFCFLTAKEEFQKLCEEMGSSWSFGSFGFLHVSCCAL
jgi:hypothetical protein